MTERGATGADPGADYGAHLELARRAAAGAGLRGDDVDEAAARTMLNLLMVATATGAVPGPGWVRVVAVRRARDLMRDRTRHPTTALPAGSLPVDSHEQAVVAAEEAAWLLDQISRFAATSMSDAELAAMERLLAFDAAKDGGEVTVRGMLRAVLDVRPDLFAAAGAAGPAEAGGPFEAGGEGRAAPVDAERTVERAARNLQRPLARLRARFGPGLSGPGPSGPAPAVGGSRQPDQCPRPAPDEPPSVRRPGEERP